MPSFSNQTKWHNVNRRWCMRGWMCVLFNFRVRINPRRLGHRCKLFSDWIDVSCVVIGRIQLTGEQPQSSLSSWYVIDYHPISIFIDSNGASLCICPWHWSDSAYHIIHVLIIHSCCNNVCLALNQAVGFQWGDFCRRDVNFEKSSEF